MKSRNIYLYILFSCITFCHISIGQTAIDYNNLAKEYGIKHLSTLQSFLSIPCDANDNENILKNVDWVQSAYEKMGFTSLKLETPTVPVLLLQKMADKPNAKTVMFYFHADGQPVVPSEWKQKDPFVPVFKEKDTTTNQWLEIPDDRLKREFNPDWRIFARASSDDKGPGIMLLGALDALQFSGLKNEYNIKILVDFEEEKGSVHLPGIVQKYKDVLQSDLLLVLDGPAHDSNLPTLAFGARGILTVTLTTYGAYNDLHSGHFGNYVYNPAWRMVKLLSTMKTSSGRVLVQGFYDGVVIDRNTKEYLKTIPDNISALYKRLGIKKSEKVGESYRESLMYPSLNIRGLKSGETAEKAGTIIPERAVAEIDIRTVTQTPPESLLKKLRTHIEKHGYHIVENDPTPEERAKYDNIIKIGYRPPYGAFSTPMNGKPALWLEKAINKTSNQPLVKLPVMGGSLPISPFVSQLGIPAIIVPTVNSDNNQHSFDENLRLGNFIDGIRIFMGILTTPFE
jgi:acetylornithine deacetylase/succinyl-diaminopimelate desuccinylase-like protein